MILLNPAGNNVVSVFVRNSQTTYNISFTNQSTKNIETFDLPFTATNTFEGEINFVLPMTPEKNTFYTLIMRSGGKIENYSVCYCGDNLTQRYSRKGEFYTQPTKDKPAYSMPDKT